MPLTLKELMQKAEKKGMKHLNTNTTTKKFLKTWQQESIIYNNEKVDSTNTTQQKPLELNTSEISEHSVSNALAINKFDLDKNIDTLVGKEKILLRFLFQKCQSIG